MTVGVQPLRYSKLVDKLLEVDRARQVVGELVPVQRLVFESLRNAIPDNLCVLLTPLLLLVSVQPVWE